MSEQGPDPENAATGTLLDRPVTDVAAEDLAFVPIRRALAEMVPFSPVAGVVMHSLSGGAIMLNMVRFEPQTAVPRHQHPHEQAGYVLRGSLELAVGDETWTMRPGDGYAIPPNLPHAATAGPDGADVLDIFSPPREDYRDRG